ncbi:NUDIX hydrolase [Streptomyces pseudovenezuelae]|uniref:NUDIX hydrolase n=1 Tax=Streptomyces pseudovenezuelae TaxID=67350 RepID=UPI002E809D23|nr:NUDIX hydrolase [Streptomyces pseudovenezuelae]
MTETLETVHYTTDIVCTRDNHLLTIERGWPPHQGKLALPGGYVDPGETSLNAAVRELAEETGVQVTPEKLTLIGVYDQPDRDPRGRHISAAYQVTVPATTTAHAGDDAAAIHWIPLDDSRIGLAFDHDQIVTDALHHHIRACWFCSAPNPATTTICGFCSHHTRDNPNT